LHPASATPDSSAAPQFPRAIHIDRPHDDYRIDVQVTKLTVNEELPAERFQLAQPPNSELVKVGEERAAAPPKDGKP
jgi:hypothetical protein